MAGPTLEQVMEALQAADAAGNVEDATQLANMAAAMMSQQQTQQEDVPSAVQQTSTTGKAKNSFSSLGRGLASALDVTVGNVLPTAAQMIAYPVARAGGKSPEEAQAASQRIASSVDSPFGKAFGVTSTPEYQQEGGRQLMNFIGENFQKGAKWIASKTGIPEQDVESYMGSLSLAAPAVAKPVARAAAPVLEEAALKAKTAVQAPFAEQIKARNQRLSSEDYARGPQIDAATEAQRLGIALKPTDIQPTAGKKLLTQVAGEEGLQAIQAANKDRIRKIALNEMDLPPDLQLDGPKAFEAARMKVAKPYNEIRALPTMVADETTLTALNDLRPDSVLIGSDKYAKATNAIIDDAVKKVSKGLDGEQLLKNVSTLRQRAKKTYNNKSATLEALDAADTNLAIANALETMIESNVTNPKLLTQFRDARQKMARTYAYEGATDFNTGIIDVNRLAKITAKDNAMQGDIAALGKIGGNFPDAFTSKASKPLTKTDRISRASASGSLGGVLGYAMGGDYTSAALGSVLGAGAGEFISSAAARRVASPEYQKGLQVRDMRIPMNQATATVQPIPQGQAIVPYQAPVEVLGKGEGPYQPNFTMQPNQYGPRVSVVPPETSRALPAPSAESTMASLRAEDTRRASISREIGRQQEIKQASVEASERKPASGGVTLEFDPITGRFKEASQGIKGATPDTFRNFGASLESASNKVSQGRLFDLSAAEKVAWDKTKVDLKEAMPSFKALSNKEIAERMLDRQWVAEAAQKARDKAAAFEQLAYKAKTMREVEVAKANRERMLDLAEQMEAKFGGRPDTSRKVQGPKTREAFRQGLFTGGQ